jgi:lipoprotein-releasing system permease protein
VTPSDPPITLFDPATRPKSGGTAPFAAFEWLLSWRYLRSRRKERAVSVITGFAFAGIVIGVAALLVAMAVLNGFRKELLGKLLGLNGHLMALPAERPLDDWGDVLAALSTVGCVKLAVPLLEGQALAAGQDKSGFVLARGLRGEDLAKLAAIAGNVKEGTLAGFDSAGGIVIGQGLATDLKVHAGDTIKLYSPHGPATPFGTMPRIKAYRIAAVFELGMAQYDALFVFLPLAEAQAYFSRGDEVSAIEIHTADPEAIDGCRADVERHAGRPLAFNDWRQRGQSFFAALALQRTVMFVIVGLIVLVAALNIISGLTILVKDKERDIAILRSMGATRAAIARIFVICGAAIGAAGTAGGFLLAAVICPNAEAIRQLITSLTGIDPFSKRHYLLSQLPAEMDPAETAAVLALAFALSLVATLYPSWRAARVDPVELLRRG